MTFEIFRTTDGRLTARSVRRLGSDKNGASLGPPGLGGRDPDDDRPPDWTCSSCRERNYARRSECYRCKAPQHSQYGAKQYSQFSQSNRRSFSPHAGARAIRESIAASRGGVGRRRSSSSGEDAKEKSKKRQKKRSSTSTEEKSCRKDTRSSSSSSGDNNNKRSKSRSNSSSCVIDDGGTAGQEASQAAEESPELAKAKAEALEQLVRLKDVQPKEQRMTEWRALLRHWHPDKNPQRTEVATAVFQFLQKGKLLMDTS